MIGESERLLTKKARRQLIRLIDELIEIAAQGNAGYSDYIADNIAVIVTEGQRKLKRR